MTNESEVPTERELAIEQYLAEAFRAGRMGCDRLVLVNLDEYPITGIDAETARLKDSLDRIAKLMGNFN